MNFEPFELPFGSIGEDDINYFDDFHVFKLSISQVSFMSPLFYGMLYVFSTNLIEFSFIHSLSRNKMTETLTSDLHLFMSFHLFTTFNKTK